MTPRKEALRCLYQFFDDASHVSKKCGRPKGHKGNHLEMGVTSYARWKGDRPNREKYLELFSVASLKHGRINP